MKHNVLMPLPSIDFDPTEAAVVWKILSKNNVKVTFATPDGEKAHADPVMVTGRGLGIFKWSLQADKNGRVAYKEMFQCEEFNQPISYESIKVTDYDGLLLPGGHAKGVVPYLESSQLHEVVYDFYRMKKTIGAICHGVLVLVNTINKDSGHSIIYENQVTTLPSWMELLAYYLTFCWMGDYYKTYPNTTTEALVKKALKEESQYKRGPFSLDRDASKRQNGFVLKDKNLITSRWPGDAHTFAYEVLNELNNSPSASLKST